ncbi:hypothetical protein BGZ95_003389 [Linnemannia exigua]|uniref:Uncharacterized protein n=1 Tax=Linnemannia exigua TaxID=604196 RepID=A0AAD4D4B7_9FUNG|nr:hypothetical protein BGZ95_003389 [Linnemannia exigua]
MSRNSSKSTELYTEYFKSRDVESMSPIDFFQFEGFFYKHRTIASQEWQLVVLPVIEKINRKRAKILKNEWDIKPHIRSKYWTNKQQEEEKPQITKPLPAKDSEKHLGPSTSPDSASNSTDANNSATVVGNIGDGSGDLDGTEEAGDMYNNSPLESIGPTSDPRTVDDAGQAADSGALDDVDVAAPGHCPKWQLDSGTVVEDVLLKAGLELTVDHPIRSFMIDLQDKYTESLFSPQDWTEIKSNLPPSATYSTETAAYLDTLEDIIQEQDIISVLDSRPCHPEKAIVRRCVESWCDLYRMDPSPFALESVLSEDWWMNNAWHGTRLLANAVPGSYIITGEVTGVDSTSRRNNKERHVNIAPQNNRKRMGVRADMIWRTVEAPVRDWMIGEAARQWDENAGKYVRESTFKVETLHLIDEYNRAKQEERKEKRARSSSHHVAEDDWRGEEDWRDLLNSSP